MIQIARLTGSRIGQAMLNFMPGWASTAVFQAVVTSGWRFGKFQIWACLQRLYDLRRRAR
jgi:hypothetical protein